MGLVRQMEFDNFLGSSGMVTSGIGESVER